MRDSTPFLFKGPSPERIEAKATNSVARNP